MNYTRKRDVTPQLFSLQHQPHLYVRIVGQPTRVKAGELARSEDGSIPVIPVVNLESGEEGMLILPTVLERVLADAGPLVGKQYEIEDRGIREGKNYRDVRVWEIE